MIERQSRFEKWLEDSQAFLDENVKKFSQALCVEPSLVREAFIDACREEDRRITAEAVETGYGPAMLRAFVMCIKELQNACVEVPGESLIDRSCEPSSEITFDDWIVDNERLLRKCVRTYANFKFLTGDEEDVMQELRAVCWEAWQSWDASRGTRFGTYAYNSCKLKIFEMMRGEKAAKRSGNHNVASLDETDENGCSLSDCLEATDGNPEDKVMCDGILDIFRKEVAALDERNQKIVKLVFVQNEKQADVADMFGISQPAVSHVCKVFRTKVAASLRAAGYGSLAA